MFGIGPMELVVIVVVALLIFGPQKLPEFARTIGKGLAEFRRASNDLRQSLALDELHNDLRKTMNDATRVPASRPAQAGDTLPPGSSAAASPGEPAATSATSAATATTATTATPTSTTSTTSTKSTTNDDRGPASDDPPWKSHPGELPEGIDHDHHEPAAGTSAPSAPRTAHDPRRDGDPELGNVPVTGVDPSDPRRG